MQETLKKAEQVKLRVKVESPEVQEALTKLGYEKGLTVWAKKIDLPEMTWFVIVTPEGLIKISSPANFGILNARYQVELYLLIAAGVVTFE